MKCHQCVRFLCAMATLPIVLVPTSTTATPPQVGDPAPPLDLDVLLQAPDGAKADWDSLRGKVVVLEFWATWCVPCVRDIPFFNKLQDAFKDKPVQFISITDESKSVVTPFLEKEPIHGWVGLDSDGETFRAYAVAGRPTTVVVDQQGKLVGWTILSSLVEHPEILDDLLAGRPRRLGEATSLQHPELFTYLGLDIDGLADSGTNQPLCLIVIRPAQPIEPKAFANTGRASLESGVTLRSAIARMYNVAWHRIVGTAQLPEDREYDIIFSWPEGDYQRGRALLREAFEATFNLRIRPEKRTMDVYVLGVPPGGQPRLEAGMSRMLYDEETGNYAPTSELLQRMKAGEKFFLALGDTHRIAQHLDHALGRPVVDETGIDLDGYYWFYFPYDRDKPDKEYVIKTVEEKYGLTLTPAKREVEVLVVDEAKPSDGATE